LRSAVAAQLLGGGAQRLGRRGRHQARRAADVVEAIGEARERGSDGRELAGGRQARTRLARLPRVDRRGERAHLAFVLLADAVALVAVLIEQRVDLLRHRRDVAVAEHRHARPRIVEPEAPHRGGEMAERQGAPPRQRRQHSNQQRRDDDRPDEQRLAQALRVARRLVGIAGGDHPPAQLAERRRADRGEHRRPSISYSSAPASPPFSTAGVGTRGSDAP
jgi:hypothetical protein